MIEAMAAGRPVIGTDIRGCRELINKGQNGWLVPPRNIDALAAAITAAASLTVPQLVALGEAGKRKASTEFRESQVLDRLIRVYEACGLTTPVRMDDTLSTQRDDPDESPY
jgi:glycosyltransferase involved in cell wall biosynthesis